jgi:hypothetical protein
MHPLSTSPIPLQRDGLLYSPRGPKRTLDAFTLLAVQPYAYHIRLPVLSTTTSISSPIVRVGPDLQARNPLRRDHPVNLQVPLRYHHVMPVGETVLFRLPFSPISHRSHVFLIGCLYLRTSSSLRSRIRRRRFWRTAQAQWLAASLTGTMIVMHSSLT